MKKLIIIISIALASCTAQRPLHSGLTHERVTSTEKIKDGTVVTIAGSSGKYIVPSDTIKVGDTIAVSWIQPIRK